MKGAFWVPLSSVLFAITWPCTEQCGFGYELMDYRMDQMQEKMTQMFEKLVNSVESNEKKIDELAKSITNFIESNQKSTDMSAVEKKISQKLEVLDEIVENQSDILNQLNQLETTEDLILSKQRLAENRISGIVSSVATLDNQSKQLLKNHFDLVIPSCSATRVPGIYTLQFPSINVFCEPSGGGWLVIQQRLRGDINFYASMYDYRMGFGTIGPRTDFWLGLEAIHQITNSGEFELSIDISSESDGYRLTIGGYTGTAGDQMSYHNQMKFSTYDKDNDFSKDNCAKVFQSGWWFKDCHTSNLNGPANKGFQWGSWKNTTVYSRIMIRRK